MTQGRALCVKSRVNGVYDWRHAASYLVIRDALVPVLRLAFTASSTTPYGGRRVL
jgi:hypothetical protein